MNSQPRHPLLWVLIVLLLPLGARSQGEEVLGHLRAMQYPEALAGAQALSAKEPRSADARALLGRVLEALGEVEKANGAYREALSLQSGHSDSLAGLASTAAHLGRHKEAVWAYKEILKRGGETAFVRVALARSLIALGQPREAATLLRKGLRDNPGSPSILLELARIERRSDRPAQARKMLEGVMSLDPDQIEAADELADLLCFMGAFGEALALGRKMERRLPEDPLGPLRQAQALAHLGKAKEARAALARARALLGEGCLPCMAHVRGRMDEVGRAIEGLLKSPSPSLGHP